MNNEHKKIGEIVEDVESMPLTKVQKKANIASNALIIISICLIVIALVIMLVTRFVK